MNADTTLVLGDLSFSRYEVPERIQFGGDQMLAVHELVGGKRIVDSMGRQDKPLEWTGTFIGDNASERARFLNNMRIAGKPLSLTWDAYYYRVVIKTAVMDFKRYYEIPYSISCVVVEDVSTPVSSLALSSIDSAITDDMNAANGLGISIGDSPLSGLLSTLNTSIATVSSFATAAQSTINSVLTPLAAVQARVGILIASTGNTIANIATVGGILPGNPVALQAARLTAQINGYTQMPRLLNLQSAVGRMGANLASIGGAGKSVVTAGGNLFTLASKAYGDAATWATLARVNKISDPNLVGIQTIIVPPKADGVNGVFGA